MINKLCLAAILLATPLLVLGQSVHFEEGLSIRNKKRGHYYKMATWDDGQYAEFAYWEKSALNSIVDHMNWRAIFPPGYTKGSGTKYPMIVMFHGAGESGRKFTDSFNYATTDPRYDNNSNQLNIGGEQHMEAVRRDPSDPRAFPGIVMFPQVSYNGAWNDIDIRMLNGILEYMIKEYSVDPDRIAINGLSNGAKAVWKVAAQRPDLFAAVLSMSGVGTDLQAMTDSLATTPIWIFQGSKDTNPSPEWSRQWIDAIISKGGEARSTVYNRGHFVWFIAYKEPDLFSWILSKDKKNIRFMGGEPASANCSLTAEYPVQLGFSAGYLAYQWTKNGIPLLGATGRYFTPTASGAYTVKFKRQTNNTWAESNPVNVFYSEPNFAKFKPSLTTSSSADLPLPFSDSLDYTLNLVAPAGFAAYNWYKNGVLIESNERSAYNLNDNTGQKFVATDAGSYAVLLTDRNGCNSLVSDPAVVTFSESGSNISALVPYMYATSSLNLRLLASIADRSLKLVANAGFAAYRWFKNGALLTESSANELVLNNLDGDQFVPGDAGDYYVVVVNTSGSLSQGSNIITITYDPASDGNDAAITELSPYMYATSSLDLPLHPSMANKSLSLVAPAGYTSYKWHKDNALVSEGVVDRLTLNDAAGEMFVPENAGDYYVVVANPQGSSLPSNIITVAYRHGAYDPPNGLEKTILSSNEIAISWSDTGYEDAYEIYRARKNTFNDGGGTSTGYPGRLYHFVATLPANTTSFIDSNLRPRASYNYMILAMQAGGGVFSDEGTSYVTTLADSSIPTTPQDLMVVYTTESEIYLQWTPSADDDVVFGYEVYLDGEKIADVLSASVEGDRDPTDGSPEPAANYIVSTLKSRKLYDLKVRAVDYQGNNFRGNTSEFSNLVTSGVVLGIPGTSFSDEKALAYPNPFTQQVFIKLPDKRSAELPVLLFNHTGNLVKVSTTSGSGEEISVDLSDVADGLYILRVGDYNFRIIKRN